MDNFETVRDLNRASVGVQSGAQLPIAICRLRHSTARFRSVGKARFARGACRPMEVKMSEHSPMPLSQVLFSFNGRIPRSVFWLKFYIPAVVVMIVLIILDYALGTYDSDVGFGWLSGIFSFLIIYPDFAVIVKRLHDRGRSGWFLFLFFVPIANIWMLIETMFLRGTVGENEYGHDPT